MKTFFSWVFAIAIFLLLGGLDDSATQDLNNQRWLLIAFFALVFIILNRSYFREEFFGETKLDVTDYKVTGYGSDRHSGVR